jgi:hypothetical protein
MGLVSTRHHGSHLTPCMVVSDHGSTGHLCLGYEGVAVTMTRPYHWLSLATKVRGLPGVANEGVLAVPIKFSPRQIACDVHALCKDGCLWATSLCEHH